MRNSLMLMIIQGAIITLTSCFSMAGATERATLTHDSVNVSFRQGKANIDPGFDGNGQRIDSLYERIITSGGDIKQIEVVGGASPEGSVWINRNLSRRRADSLIRYMGDRFGLNDSLSTFRYLSRDWRGLRSFVLADPDVPSRAEVLALLDEIIAAGEESEDSRNLERLKMIGRGTPYIYMYRTMFPALRRSVLYADYVSSVPDISWPEIEPLNPALILSPTPPHFIQLNSKDLSLSNLNTGYKPRHILALKTNLLYYAALMPNIGVEWLFSDDWSVAAEGNIAYWTKASAFKSHIIYMFDAELRRWIMPRAPWHGFYAGVFAGGGLYQFENGKRGYQGEGVLTGISCGYMWPISRNLSFETGIGAGYLYTRVREYIPYEGHYVYQRTKAINYFGPLKLYFSLVWRFLDKNKPRQKGLQL